MKIIFKTYNFLVLLATLLLVLSFFIPISNLDINFGSTYYMTTNICLLRLSAVILFIVAIFYRLLNPFLAWDILSWIHILLSILLLIAHFYTKYNFNRSLALVELNENSSAYFQRFNIQLAAIGIGFLFVQLLPIINLIVGLVKRKRSTT